MENSVLPVAVIGAGPVGLAAAAHLVQRGEVPVVFEAGADIAASVRSWGHVRLFSPWRWCTDKAAVALLETHNWQAPPPDLLPTGQELIEQYLLPLAQTPELAPRIHLNARVIAVSRRRIDKMKDAGREQAPFVIQVIIDGVEQRFLARAVIDASGTWTTPNPLGADGLFAPGETENAAHIAYGIPDVLGKERPRFEGKRVAVIGGGHSAINAILELMDLREAVPATHVTWILRKSNVADTYGGLEDDQLPGRGSLGLRIKELVEAGAIEVVTPFFTTRIEAAGEQVQLFGETPRGERAIVVDEIIGATGARPDLSFLREVRLDLHSSVEAPTAIAPLIDPNLHSCGSVPPHGERELRHPEAGYYMVGMKSYGRAPTFLLATGYEQVRSVVAALADDWQAAAEVQLELPETGVCGVPASVNANELGQETACCGSSTGASSETLVPLQAGNLPQEAAELSPVTVSVNGHSANGYGKVKEPATNAIPVAADGDGTPDTQQEELVLSSQSETGSCCG